MKKKEKQMHFPFFKKQRKDHGGEHAKEHGGEAHAKTRKRKEARPFDPAKQLHITMRSSLAVGKGSMLHPSRSRIIRMIVFRAAKRHGIILREFVCVGNHLHFLIQTKSRRIFPARLALRRFLREVAGLIARLMTGAKKGQPALKRFWDYLTWSRIVEWGRDLAGIKKYFQKNIQEFLYILFQNNWPTPEWPP